MARRTGIRVGTVFAAALLGATVRGGAQEPAPPVPQRQDLSRLELGKPFERELPAGETHSYEVALDSGQFLRAVVDQRGVDLIVRVFAPSGDKIADIDSPNGTQGPEPVELVALTTGVHRIDVGTLRPATTPGRYAMTVEQRLTVAQYVSRQARERAKRDTVVHWLRKNAIPLRSVTAGTGFADLQPLKRVLATVRVVGLGEETHGTREFFQFKHRMVEFLVREMGFRMFAIEASYSECVNIDDYIMGRTDDGAKALDSQGFWTWNTEEMRAMLDWMRAYNAGVPAEQKLRFAGFDIQGNERGKREILAYLQTVAPERVAETEAFFKVNLDSVAGMAMMSRDEKQRGDAAAALRDAKVKTTALLGFLTLNEGQLERLAPRPAFEQARAYARVLAQHVDSYSRTDSPSAGAGLREYYMAENLKRLVDDGPPSARVVAWAHNSHVSTSDDGGRYLHMGHYLRRWFGASYYAFGLSFNRGAFQAFNSDPQAKVRGITEFTVGPALDGSIDWYLAQAGNPSFVVDLRSQSARTALADWLGAPRPMRNIGSMFRVGMESAVFRPRTLGQEFDGLVFFDSVTRARPNPSVPNVAGRATP